MGFLRLADPEGRAGSRSPLGDSLLQLARRRRGAVTPATPADKDWEACLWRELWDANHVQISRRLALIQAELDRLEPGNGNATTGPQLGIFPDGSHPSEQS